MWKPRSHARLKEIECNRTRTDWTWSNIRWTAWQNKRLARRPLDPCLKMTQRKGMIPWGPHSTSGNARTRALRSNMGLPHHVDRSARNAAERHRRLVAWKRAQKDFSSEVWTLLKIPEIILQTRFKRTRHDLPRNKIWCCLLWDLTKIRCSTLHFLRR